jgi:ubiquinone/menaquinone biosynthesis C-methylase UbiE
MIDYNTAARTYDNTRSASEELIRLFDQTVHFSTETVVLDFGCGTGNYLDRIQRLHYCRCYGVEPSDEMRAKVALKNPVCVVKAGDHRQIPFPDGYFDFAYMTDVIHHVADILQLFREVSRVLKEDGQLCVVTQSHAQIESRFYNRYFPSLARKEQGRYPDVPEIIAKAETAHLQPTKVEINPFPATDTVTAALVQTVEEKNFSMFRALSDEEHSQGLAKLQSNLGTVHESVGAGQSLIWLERAQK